MLSKREFAQLITAAYSMSGIKMNKEIHIPLRNVAELLAQYSEHVPELTFSENGDITWEWDEDEDEAAETTKDEINQIQDSYD